MRDEQKKPASLSDTSVDRLADEVTQRLQVAAALRQTPVQRATKAVAAVAESTLKLTPLQWVFLVVGLTVMAGGFWRMETHKHATEGGYVHLGSDWLIVSVGIAFMPTAGERVGKGLKALGAGFGGIFGAVVSLVRGVKGTDK